MKLFSLFGAVAIATLLVVSCEEKHTEIVPSTEGTGYLQLFPGFDIKSSHGRVATDTGTVNTDTWNVIIYDSTGTEVHYYPDYTDVPAEVELPVGNYTVTVDSENNGDSVAFANPHYTGTQSFTIVGGDLTSVTVTAALTNVKVTISNTDRVKDNFSDYHTTISSSSGTLTFDSVETRSGYFPAGEPLTLEAVLSFTRSDGVVDTYTIKHTIDSTNANDHYEVTLDCELEDGILTPLFIAVAPTNDISVELCCVTSPVAATSCRGIKEADPDSPSGIYTLNLETGALEVYCDMDFDGGGWTLVASIYDPARTPSDRVDLGSNTALTLVKFQELLNNATVGVRFNVEGSEAPNMLVRLANTTGMSCHNLATDGVMGLQNPRIPTSISFAHNENSGCTGAGSDYSLVGFDKARGFVGHYHYSSKLPYIDIYVEGDWVIPTNGSADVYYDVSESDYLDIYVK